VSTTADRLVYVGHTGTGFDEKELARVMAKLKPLETKECPFAEKPKSNERPHWVRPDLVAQIKFTEWTADLRLRHPVYLGLRDDKRPHDVVRESGTRLHSSVARRLRDAPKSESAPVSRIRKKQRATASGPSRTEIQSLLDQLTELEKARRDGHLQLPGGDTLSVTNLHKVFWPALKLTKGDLFRYYAHVAPAILPVLADRPLVMKRYPNGVHEKPFYQHRAAEAPAGIRVEPVHSADARPQLVGGNLKTLLYTSQLAAISQDPWFSRVQTPGIADQVALDLDPPDDLPFGKVLDVARWIRDELEGLSVLALPKTSGSSGLHIYIPLAPGTPYESGLLFCQLVATLVAEKHPKAATGRAGGQIARLARYVRLPAEHRRQDARIGIQRTSEPIMPVSRRRLRGRRSTRASSREDFTLRTVPGRVDKVGDSVVCAAFRPLARTCDRLRSSECGPIAARTPMPGQ
jgi:bifunctional non-homologous end joining protein LigD